MTVIYVAKNPPTHARRIKFVSGQTVEKTA